MALSKESLKNRIVTELEQSGFVTLGQYAWTERFAKAVANAVVDEIQLNAEVGVEGVGYPVE